MFHHPKASNNTRFYEVLGAASDASPEQLKKAYKKAAIRNHPDKGGDPDKFKDVAQAYEVLSDPRKREIYDQYGEDAIKEGMADGESSENPFSMFENLFRPGRGGQRQRRGEDIEKVVEVSLEELYNGATKNLSLPRNVLCEQCKGKGSKSGDTATCKNCDGQGVKITTLRKGPFQQMVQHVCPACSGTGERIDENDRCPGCDGRKVLLEIRPVDVFIERGMRHGQKITFRNQANEEPDAVPGDIVVFIKEKEHPTFKRKADDLFMDHTLSLSEALCGFAFTITHLDGRKLLIRSVPGEIVRPDEFKAINDEGMPNQEQPSETGRLYIHFKVEFPKSGSFRPEQLKLIESMLPPKPSLSTPQAELEACEETILHEVDIEEEMKRKQQEQRTRQQAYDEDDEDGPRVQCAQQ